MLRVRRDNLENGAGEQELKRRPIARVPARTGVERIEPSDTGTTVGIAGVLRFTPAR